MSKSRPLLDLRAANRYLKVIRAMSKGRPVTVQEYADAYEEVFRSPPPVGSDTDYETAKTLVNAVLEVVPLHGREVKGPGGARRKLETPQGLSITMSVISLPTADKKADVELKFVGRLNKATVFTLLITLRGDQYIPQLSWDEGSWLEPFIEYSRTICPPEAQGGQS